MAWTAYRLLHDNCGFLEHGCAARNHHRRPEPLRQIVVNRGGAFRGDLQYETMRREGRCVRHARGCVDEPLLTASL